MIKKMMTFVWEKIFKRPDKVDEAKFPRWLRGYIPAIALAILVLLVVILLKSIGKLG
jgi:hypothetical protein